MRLCYHPMTNVSTKSRENWTIV